MSHFQTVEKQLSDGRDARYQLRILPYRSVENKIDGAVMTNVELFASKAAAEL
jgi:hypothetical protein